VWFLGDFVKIKIKNIYNEGVIFMGNGGALLNTIFTNEVWEINNFNFFFQFGI
jgi:hypothetical protein